MNCPKCNAVNENSAKYCFSCGAELPLPRDDRDSHIMRLCRRVERRKIITFVMLLLFNVVAALATSGFFIAIAWIIAKVLGNNELVYIFFFGGIILGLIMLIVNIIVLAFLKSLTDLFVQKSIPEKYY